MATVVGNIGYELRGHKSVKCLSEKYLTKSKE